MTISATGNLAYEQQLAQQMAISANGNLAYEQQLVE